MEQDEINARPVFPLAACFISAPLLTVLYIYSPTIYLHMTLSMKCWYYLCM